MWKPVRTWVSLEVVPGHRRKTSEELRVKWSPSELLQTAETPSQVTLVPSIQRFSHACLWGGVFCCCLSTLRDLLILGSLKIFFVYLKSKPFRNPGLCHTNKEDQGQLLGLGISDLWNAREHLSAGKPEEEEQATLVLLGLYPFDHGGMSETHRHSSVAY